MGAAAQLARGFREARAATRLAAAVCLGAAAAAAGATTADGHREAFTLSAHCRSGKAQGGYALRAADGRLRVQGAYHQGERTGSFFFWSADGARIAQLPFDAGVLSGTLSLWYDGAGAQPARKLQARYRDGERDGITRLWSPDGRLRGEFEYAAGTLAAPRAWNGAGGELPEPDARALAREERDDTAAVVATLLATLARHPPDCHSGAARLQARRRAPLRQAASGRAPDTKLATSFIPDPA